MCHGVKESLSLTANETIKLEIGADRRSFPRSDLGSQALTPLDNHRNIAAFLTNTTGWSVAPTTEPAPSPNLLPQDLPMNGFPPPVAEATGLIYCAPRGPPETQKGNRRQAVSLVCVVQRPAAEVSQAKAAESLPAFENTQLGVPATGTHKGRHLPAAGQGMFVMSESKKTSAGSKKRVWKPTEEERIGWDHPSISLTGMAPGYLLQELFDHSDDSWAEWISNNQPICKKFFRGKPWIILSMLDKSYSKNDKQDENDHRPRRGNKT